MDTPTNNAEGTAPATPSTPPPATERPNVRELVAGMTSEQRRLVAAGKFDQIKPSASAQAPEPTAAPAATPAEPSTPSAPAAGASEATPQEPTPSAPATSEATEPEASTPPAESGDGAEDLNPGDGTDNAGGKSKRFRFADEKDQALVLFARAHGLSLQEAAQRLAQASTPAASTAQPSSTATPEADPELADYDNKILDANKRVEKLIADRKKAGEELEHDKELELTDAIAEAKAEAKLLANEKQGFLRNREQAGKRSYEAQVNSSRDRVFAEFDVFANPESMERLALDAYAQRALNDPKRRDALLADPKWPETIAKEFAAKKGIKPKGAAAGTAPAAPAATTPKPAALPTKQPTQVTSTQPQGAKLLTGANGQKPSAPSAMTTEDARRLIRTDKGARLHFVRNLSTTSKG